MLRIQEQLRFGCGTVKSTVEAPTGVCATAESKSDMLCCSSTAVDHNPWICAWHLYFKYVDQRVLPAWKKKGIRDPKFVA